MDLIRCKCLPGYSGDDNCKERKYQSHSHRYTIYKKKHLTNDEQKKFLPNIGVGLYYNTPKWNFGVSVPIVIPHDIDNSQMHLFLIGGALIEINRDIKLRPSVFIKSTKSAPVNMYISAYLVFKDLFWLGGMTRTAFGRIIPTGKIGGGVGLMAGININENIKLIRR